MLPLALTTDPYKFVECGLSSIMMNHEPETISILRQGEANTGAVAHNKTCYLLAQVIALKFVLCMLLT